MCPHPLKVDDDEIQRLLTQVYRETKYSLDRRDPIIVQFVVQKILLHDFTENQIRLFRELSERVMPALKDQAQEMENKKNWLWELSNSAAANVVHQTGEEYAQHIRQAMRTVDGALLESVDQHITKLRREQKSILSKMEEEHQAFVDTANQFGKVVTYFLAGGAVIVVAAAFIVVHLLGK